jgi:probable F420-dependent oxidoreductase
VSDGPDLAAWRRRLGRLGVWCTTDRLAAEDAAALAGRVESHGYGTLWVPETVGRDPFAHLAHLAAHTTTLGLATGIANIHHRHAGPMHQAARTVAEQSGGRFLLGVGVSHAPFVEGVRGLAFGRPLATMRAYLDAMDASPYGAAFDGVAPPPRLLGALGPKMLALAAERGDGAQTYWTTPEHTARARAALGPDKLLCVEQKVVLAGVRAGTGDDAADLGRRTAAKALRLYLALPNYRGAWNRLGFGDDEIDGLTDRFVDSLVAWGDADALRRRVDEHLDAGADHVCVQPMTPDHPLDVDRAALTALAPTPP